MYSNGKGVPQDYKTAAKWGTLSAEQGHTDAQTNIAAMYAFGQGALRKTKFMLICGQI